MEDIAPEPVPGNGALRAWVWRVGAAWLRGEFVPVDAADVPAVLEVALELVRDDAARTAA